MKRQKLEVEVNPSDLVQLINYDGTIIENYFINKKDYKIVHLPNSKYYLAHTYINKCKDWKNGYVKVRINGSLYNYHWLVARVLVPGYEIGLTVDHIDNNSLNNVPENLQWITRGKNIRKYWESLTPEEMDAYKQKMSEGLRKAHAEGKYKKHLENLHRGMKHGN